MLINLTEEHLKNASLLEKISNLGKLDLYSAATVASIGEYFAQNPPRKKDGWGKYSALVVINNLSIKRVDDHFAEKFPEYASLPQSMQDIISLEKIESQKYFPWFVIKDMTAERYAIWLAGTKQEYVEDQAAFGFNREYFVPIPEIYLQYRHDKAGGWLSLKCLCNSQPPKKGKREKGLETIKTWIPEIYLPDLGVNRDLLPQPI